MIIDFINKPISKNTISIENTHYLEMKTTFVCLYEIIFNLFMTADNEKIPTWPK